MAYLTVCGLSVGYADSPVAKEIAFSVGTGDAVFVIGENGAGKSTLIKTVLGLVPPLAGKVSFCDDASASEVGYLPQRSDAQRDFPASAWEVVLSGRVARLGRRPFYSRADRDAAEAAMRQVGSLDLRGKPFGTLSGGQQQRVLLARALASAPKLLVLDEPTTGLDPHAAESLWDTIDELRTGGAGVLAVTHDVDTALPHATHVLEVRDGSATFRPATRQKVEGDAQ